MRHRRPLIARKTDPATRNAALPVATLSVFTLAVMNITAVVSLRGLSAEAVYGLASAAYYLFAAVFFLVPVAIVAAELATAWPQKGGVFRWVGEAFGARLAFLAIFLLWIEITIWFPTVLTFAAVSLAYTGPDQTFDQALANNKGYTVIVVLSVYWLATLIAMRGVGVFAEVAKWGGILGTIVPAAILILLALAYVVSGGVVQMTLSWDAAVPDLSKFSNLVLAASIFLFYAGMEMNAIHVKQVRNPVRNYPLAILVSSVVTVLIFVLGTFAIAIVIPAADINIIQSLLTAYRTYLDYFGLGFLSPVIAAMLAFGVLGGVTVWVGGPSAGLHVVGQAGYLPPLLQRTNRVGAPVSLLILQALLVTVLSLMFVVLPSVEATYQILAQLTVVLYLILYMLMFAAAIRLRFSQPDTPRPYRVPGGHIGIWVFAGAGFIAALVAFGTSFVPPSQVGVGSPAAYIGLLVVGAAFFVALAFIIFACRKPSWHVAQSDFAPFSWASNRPASNSPVAEDKP